MRFAGSDPNDKKKDDVRMGSAAPILGNCAQSYSGALGHPPPAFLCLQAFVGVLILLTPISSFLNIPRRICGIIIYFFS